MQFSLWLLLHSLVQNLHTAGASVIHGHPVRSLNGVSSSNLSSSSHSSLSDFSSSRSSTSEFARTSISRLVPAIPTSTISTTELRDPSRPKSLSHTPQTTTLKQPANTTEIHNTGSHIRSPVHTVPANESCNSYCTYLGARQSTLIWTPACVMTLAAHTIIHVVNNRTNTTQTITNSIDLSGVDDAGIVSLGGTPTRNTAMQTTVTLSRGPSSALTTVINYPNTIVEYPYMYSLEGVALDAMLDGIHVNTTCAASVTSSTITLPSHPPLPTAATTGVPDDSKSDSLDVSTGMVACRNVVIGDLTIVPSSVTTTTIVPVWKKGDVPIEFYRSAFSDNRAFQKCKSSTGREVLGKITFVQAVQFLTETSTSYATGIGPIRTIKDPGTQATTAESAQSPTTTAKNVISSDALITASKIIASHALVSPIASTQAPQVNLGDNILPIRPTTLTASGDSDISPVLVPAFVIGTQTVALGTEAAVTIAGTPVAVRTSNGLTFVVVGDSAHASTIQLSLDPSKSTITPPPIIVGETTIAPSLQTTVPPLIISGQTLVPGEALILSGNSGAIVALATDTAGNSILVAGGKTTTLASRIQSLPIVLAGYTFAPQPASTGYIISGQTLTFGGSVAIQDTSSTKIVLLTTNSVGQAVLISNGQTAMIPSLVPGPLTVDGITLSPIPSSAVYEYHVSDKILTMGGTITIGAVPSQTILVLSTNSAGQTIIVENGQTTTMISSMISTKTTTGAPSNIAIADVIGSVMGLPKPIIETSSTASVSFSLGSNVPSTTSTPSSSGSDSLLIDTSRILGVWVVILGFAILP